MIKARTSESTNFIASDAEDDFLLCFFCSFGNCAVDGGFCVAGCMKGAYGAIAGEWNGPGCGYVTPGIGILCLAWGGKNPAEAPIGVRKGMDVDSANGRVTGITGAFIPALKEGLNCGGNAWGNFCCGTAGEPYWACCVFADETCIWGKLKGRIRNCFCLPSGPLDGGGWVFSCVAIPSGVLTVVGIAISVFDGETFFCIEGCCSMNVI